MSDLCATCGKSKFAHSFDEVNDCKKKINQDITTLRVRKITRDSLAKICTKEMSFDDVITQLLKSYDEHGK